MSRNFPDRGGTFLLLPLIAAYAAMFLHIGGASRSFALALAAGGCTVAAIGMLTASRVGHRLLVGGSSWLAGRRTLAALFVLLPWLAILVVVLTRGLWWTQRPPALRLFVEYGCVLWSLWCSASVDVRRTGIDLQRLLLSVAAILATLGVTGSAFGLNPFGCAVSIGLAIGASAVLLFASLASRTAGLQLLTSIVATVVGLAIGEGAVRLLRAGQTAQETNSREYALQFFSLTPPRAAFVNRPGPLDEVQPALVEINSLGIRGPELADRRMDVLLLGDSFVEARQLPWDQTTGARLDALMRERGRAVRVRAHGMRGWSPLLEWNWYLKVGRTLHPRLVVLFFFWNDLWASGSEAATFHAILRPDGRPEAFALPIDPPWIWYSHVRLIRLAEETWRRLGVDDLKRAFVASSARVTQGRILSLADAQRVARSGAAPQFTTAELRALLEQPNTALTPELQRVASNGFWSTLRPRALWTTEQQQAAEVTERELAAFAQDVAQDGGQLAILYVANPLQVDSRECSVGRFFDRVGSDVVLPPDSGIQSWLRDVTARLNLPFADPTAAMRAFDAAQPADAFAPLYLRADCHWSARGHAFVAEFLAGQPWLAGG
jgi:hypothetical protein